MKHRILASLFALVLFAMPFGEAAAQGTQVPFGSLSHDTSAPVEISSDELTVNQADGTAEFRGNVVVGQGEMRLSAGLVRVEYAADAGRIARFRAEGGVTFVNGSEAAEAEEAVYDLESGEVVLSGGVILSEGDNALSADRLVIDLRSGTGRMEGSVRTILRTGDQQ